jgi:hypothetical protein
MKALLLLGLAACGSDAFFYIAPAGDAGPDADPAEGAAADARAEASSDDASKPDVGADAADGAMCSVSGSASCADVINAYCTHYASCCQAFPGNGNCSLGWANAPTCKAFYTQNGYDCSSGKYNKAVCADGLMCSSNINAATCTAIFQSTGPNDNGWFPKCPPFWGQFP